MVRCATPRRLQRRPRGTETALRFRADAERAQRLAAEGVGLSRWERDKRVRARFGHDLEQRAIVAFAEGDLPAWLLRVRPATEAEDLSGIDMWLDTTIGPIPVQVKSSAARAVAFREAHPLGGIAVVVLHPQMSDAAIREKIIEHGGSELERRKRGRVGSARS